MKVRDWTKNLNEIKSFEHKIWMKWKFLNENKVRLKLKCVNEQKIWMK